MSIRNPQDQAFAGNARTINITVRDGTGALLNLTGYSAKWVLCSYANGAPVLPAILTKTVAGGGIQILAPYANGQLAVFIAEGDTLGLAGNYYWECELIDGSNNTSVVAYGDLFIQRSESR